MRSLILGLLVSAASFWLVGRSLRSLVTGTTPRFFAPTGGELAFRDAPFRFIVHAALWLLASLTTSLVGLVLAVGADPLVALASPAGVGAAWGVHRVLLRRGSRSGDGGLGAIEALGRGDRDALTARVEALPAGGERTVLEQVVRAWPEGPESPDGYRDPRAGRAAPPVAALETAVAREQVALVIAMAPAALGLVPAVTYVVHADAIQFMGAALIVGAIDLAIAAGAVVGWWVARREHAAFAEAARAASAGVTR